MCAACYVKTRPGFAEKTRARRLRRQQANPDYEFNLRLGWKYGLTRAQYDEMAEKGCAICGGQPSDRLYVDHDHKTGMVRGLLCHQCNSGLGMFKDDKSLLAKAIEYLTASK